MAQRYDTYKDSGVQWLGEIPGHWECVRSKYLLKLQSESTKRPHKIGLENIEGFTGKFVPTKSVFDGNGIDFDKGDIVYGKLRPYLCKVWLAEFDGNAVGDFYVYKISNSYTNTYAKYLMLSKSFTEICNASTYGAKMPRVSHQFISSLLFPLPPLSEQHAIVSYLDDKCGKVDEWIEKKQKEVELLGEMKQRVIADAVTRGLNPNVKMKPTGVFWWKETPEHWQKIRLGYILQKMSRQREPNSELLVCTNKGKVIKRGETKIGLIADSEEIYQGVAKGDLLIHGMDTWHGAIAVSNFDGMCTPVVHVCTSNQNLYYVAYYMQVMAYSKIFKLISNGVRQNTSDFRSWFKVDKIPIMLPPKHEQDSIVAYIADKTEKIDKMVENVNKEIEALKEYKQRLISDVVTGQIKVC